MEVTSATHSVHMVNDLIKYVVKHYQFMKLRYASITSLPPTRLQLVMTLKYYLAKMSNFHKYLIEECNLQERNWGVQNRPSGWNTFLRFPVDKIGLDETSPLKATFMTPANVRNVLDFTSDKNCKNVLKSECIIYNGELTDYIVFICILHDAYFSNLPGSKEIASVDGSRNFDLGLADAPSLGSFH